MLAAAATMLGGFLVAAARRWSYANQDYLLAFAAGVLIGLTFLDIVPESVEANRIGAVFLTAGFFFMYFIEQLAIPHHGHGHDDHGGHEAGLGWLAWLGVLIHSLVDGVAISAGAAIDPQLAGAVTAGVVMHELPEGLLAASLLMAAGQNVRRMLALTALVALATPVGAVLSSFVLGFIDPSRIVFVSQMAVAVAGGTFVYVGATDMLHHARHRTGRSWAAFFAFTLGIVMFGVKFFIYE